MIKIDLIQALEKQIHFCECIKGYKCGVFVHTFESKKIVTDVLSNIFSSHPTMEIIITPNDCKAIFENGSYIRVVNANDSVRGIRINGGIVDNEVPLSIVNAIIYPLIRKCLVDDLTDSFTMNRMYFIDVNYNDVKKAKDMNRKWRDKMDIRNFNYFGNGNVNLAYGRVYDDPLHIQELNNQKIILYKAFGIPKENIAYETEFVNKTKQMFLNISGKHEIPELKFKSEINVHLAVNTDIYNGYNVKIENGIVKVTLEEIINDVPEFNECSA